MQVACKCFHICSSMFPLSYQVALVGKRFAKKSEYFLALKHFLYCLIHFLHSVSLLAMHICTQPFLDLFSSEPSLHNTSVTSASRLALIGEPSLLLSLPGRTTKPQIFLTPALQRCTVMHCDLCRCYSPMEFTSPPTPSNSRTSQLSKIF